MATSFLAAKIVGTLTVKAFLTSLVIGYALQKIFAPPKPQIPGIGKAPGSKNRQPPNTDNTLPLFYGVNKNKGTIVAVAISSDRKKMAFILALCHGEAHAIDKVYWGDELLSFSSDYNNGLVNVTDAVNFDKESNDFLNDGRMKFRVYKSGGKCQEMIDFSPEDWGETDVMTDTCFLYVELTYDSKEGVTQLGNLSVECRGRKTKSIIQTAQTNLDKYPSGFSYSLSELYSYSDNPARCFVDYAMDRIDGGGMPVSYQLGGRYQYVKDTQTEVIATEIDLESMYELQVFCDRPIYVYVAYANSITIPTSSSTNSSAQFSLSSSDSDRYIGTIISIGSLSSDKRDDVTDYFWRPFSDTISTGATRELFTCNGAVDTNSGVGVNMVDLLMCCQATPTFELGMLGVVVNRKKDVVFPEQNYLYTSQQEIARHGGIDHRFNEKNIFGGVDISISSSVNTLNELTMNFNNRRSKFNPDQVTINAPKAIKNTNEYISSDKINLRFTDNNVEAKILGAVIMNQSRQDISVKFKTDLRGLTLRSGDLFSVTQRHYGFSDKKFRVTRLEEIDMNGAHGIEISGIEYADEIYDVGQLNDSDVAKNTTLLNPFKAGVYSNHRTNSNPSYYLPSGVYIPGVEINWDYSNSAYSNNFQVEHTYTSSENEEIKSIIYGKPAIIRDLEGTNHSYTVTSKPTIGKSVTSASQTFAPSNPETTPPVTNIAVATELYIINEASGQRSRATVTFLHNFNRPATFYTQHKLSSEAEYSEDEVITKQKTVVINALANGVYDIRIQAKDTNDIFSEYATIENVTVLGKTQPPKTPLNLIGTTLQDNIILRWDLATEIDVRQGGFVEIRYSLVSGAKNWQTAQTFFRVTGDSTSATLPLIKGVYFIKFIDDGGRESVHSAIFNNNIEASNVSYIYSSVENPLFLGTKTNCSVVGLNLRTNAYPATYTTPNIGLGYITGKNPPVFRVVTPYGYTYSVANDDFCLISDICTTTIQCAGVSAILEDNQVKFEISTTQDNIASNPTWSSFTPLLVSNNYQGWGIRVRVLLNSTISESSITINALAIKTSAVIVTETISLTTSSTADVTRSYENDYLTTVARPAVIAQITNGQIGDSTVLTKTDTNFTVSVYNNNIRQVRNLDVQISGVKIYSLDNTPALTFQNEKKLTASGTWTVPVGTLEIFIVMTGGGGGSGATGANVGSPGDAGALIIIY